MSRKWVYDKIEVYRVFEEGNPHLMIASAVPTEQVAQKMCNILNNEYPPLSVGEALKQTEEN